MNQTPNTASADDGAESAPAGAPAAEPETTQAAVTPSTIDAQTAARLSGDSDADIQPTNALVSDDELLEALSEVEASSDSGASELDDLDDGKSTDSEQDAPPAAVDRPDPVEPDADFDDPLADIGPAPDDALSDAFAAVEFDEEQASTGAEVTADDAATVDVEVSFEAEESPPEPPQGGKLRFQLGRKPQVVASENDGTPPGAGDSAAKTSSVRVPRTQLWKRVYRVTDRALDLINRPAARLPNAWRDLIGHIALTTIAVSLVAGTVIPVIQRSRSAARFVQRKRAALEQETSTAVAPVPSAATTGSDADPATVPSRPAGPPPDHKSQSTPALDPPAAPATGADAPPP